MPAGTVKGRPVGAGVGDPQNIAGLPNDMLATMPDATIKGRALGAGAGVPQDMTIAQLQALLGNPVYTQCRFVYANASTMVLMRHGGKFLTIDDKPEVIPAGGVGLTAVAGHLGVNPLYIYAYMLGSVMTLIGQAAGPGTPVVDPRNGLMVATSNPALTLVGLAYVSAGPILLEDGANQACSSYWNRLPRSYAYQQSNTTGSGTTVPLHNPIKMLCWADSAYQVQSTGYSQLNAIGVTVTQVLTDGGGSSAINVAYFSVVNAQYPFAPGQISRAADGLHSFQLGGNVNAGVGTFVATTYGTVMG